MTQMSMTLTKGNQFQYGLNQCGKQPFSENCVKIGISVWLERCSQAMSQIDTHTDKQTDIQTNCSENITPPRFCGGVNIRYSITENMAMYFVTLKTM